MMRTKTYGVPEVVWGVREETPAQDNEQIYGCISCLNSGVYEPPEVVFMINGTSYCRSHAQR